MREKERHRSSAENNLLLTSAKKKCNSREQLQRFIFTIAPDTLLKGKGWVGRHVPRAIKTSSTSIYSVVWKNEKKKKKRKKKPWYLFRPSRSRTPCFLLSSSSSPNRRGRPKEKRHFPSYVTMQSIINPTPHPPSGDTSNPAQ